MELLYDVVFKDAVTEPSVPRKRLDQLAKTPAIHVVKYCHQHEQRRTRPHASEDRVRVAMGTCNYHEGGVIERCECSGHPAEPQVRGAI